MPPFDQTNSPPSAETIAADFLAFHEGETGRAYRSDLAAFCRWADAEKIESPLDRLLLAGKAAAENIAATFLGSLESQGLKQGTIKRRFAALRSLTVFACRHELISWNLDTPQRPPKKPMAQKKPKDLTKAERAIKSGTARKCAKCRLLKPADDFWFLNKKKGTKSSYCRTCGTKKHRQWIKRMRSEGKWQVWQSAQSRKNHLVNRDRFMRRNYGIGLEEYRILHEAQQAVCAICGEAETAVDRCGRTKPLAIDHDHSTGQVRALLCARCNSGLAGFRDRPDLLAQAIGYLCHHKARAGA